jgi:hypothetical protein
MAAKTMIGNPLETGTTGNADLSSPNFAWASLIPIVLSLAGGLSGGGSGGAQTLDANTKAMLEEQKRRMFQQSGLYNEATKLARMLLPRSARMTYNGVTLPDPGIDVQPAQPTPQPSIQDPGTPDPIHAAGANLSPVSQAVKMMASGIAPTTQAKLFRR